MKEIDTLYDLYLKTNKKEEALEKILKSKELDNIIKKQIKKNNIYNKSYDDLYQDCLITSEKLIKNFDKSKCVPLEAYLNKYISYTLLNGANNSREIKRGKGTQIRIKRAKELMKDHTLEEVIRQMKIEFNIKKDKTIYNYIKLNSPASELYDENLEEEIETNFTDDELINLLKNKVGLSNKRLNYVCSIYGLNTKKLRSCEIAKSHSCSKANISKELKKALKQIEPYTDILNDLKLRSK